MSMCWRRLLRVPWTARRSNQSILKEIHPEYSPHVRGQGQRPRAPDCNGAGTADRSYPASEVGEVGVAERRFPMSEVRGGDERSYPTSEVRGGGREEQPHVQGAVAGRAQEGLEELSHAEGQEGRW